MEDGNIRIFEITPTVKNDHNEWLVWWTKDNIQQKKYCKTWAEVTDIVDAVYLGDEVEI